MRLSACVVPTFVLLAVCSSAYAQQKSKADAQQDELLGPVKSVTGLRLYEPTAEQRSKLVQFFVMPPCAICEYDTDGNRVTQGQILDGRFIGETLTLRQDAGGRVQRVTESTPVAQIRSEVMGPFGRTELTLATADNVITRQTFAYDANGNLADWRSFDSAGASTGHTEYTSTTKGENTLRASYDKDDNLLWRETWDPQTDESRFASYDASGRPQVTWSMAHGKVLSFWAASDTPGQFGEVLWDDTSDRDATWFHCSKSGGCTSETEHREYLGPGKQNIQSRVWRDSANNIKWSAEYEYELDSHGNWTHRTVWVTPAGESRSKFYEDSRLITYWNE